MFIRIRIPHFTAILASLAMLGSCTAGDSDDVVPEDKAISFATEGGSVWLSSSSSRAGEPESAYPISSIGIYGYANASGSLTIFNNEQALSSDNGLNYTTTNTAYWNPLLYRFFAYSPYQASDIAPEGASYSSFATFNWSKLSGFSAEDYMVSTAIVLRDNTDLTSTSTVQFSMRHIYARIRFLFKIGTDYDDMREIRVKKMEVLQAGSIKSVDLKYTPTSANPFIWSNSVMGTCDPVEIHPSPSLAGGVLKMNSSGAGYEEYASVYVYPQNIANIRFRVTYDVYDTPSYATEQIPVREDEVVESSIPITWGAMESGKYYNLKINIEPRFIYTITDTDQCDGYIVIK